MSISHPGPVGAIAVVASLLAIACERVEVRSEPSSRATRPVRLEVVNLRFDDVVVLADRGGARARLGTVVARGSVTFDLPAEMVGATGVRFVAEPIGSALGFMSDEVVLVGGDLAVWTLRDPAPQSSLAVR